MEVPSKQIKTILGIVVLIIVLVLGSFFYQNHYGFHKGVNLSKLSSKTAKKLIELEKFDSHPGYAVGASGKPSYHYEIYHEFYKELTAEEAKELINHSHTLIKSTAFRKLYQGKSPLLFDLMVEASQDTVSMVYEDAGCTEYQYSLFGYYLKVCKYPKPFNIRSINKNFTPFEIQQIDSLAKSLFEADSKELERIPQRLPVPFKIPYDSTFEKTFESKLSKLEKNIITFYTDSDSTLIPIPAIMDIGQECTYENENHERLYVFRTNYTDYKYRLVTNSFEEFGKVTLYKYFYLGTEFRGRNDELPVNIFHPTSSNKKVVELGMENNQLSEDSNSPYVTIRLHDSIPDVGYSVFNHLNTERIFHYFD